MVRALDLRLDGREFDSGPQRLILGWMTVFGQANYFGYLGQLSLLRYAERETSTSQSAVMLSDWGVKAGVVHSTCG